MSLGTIALLRRDVELKAELIAPCGMHCAVCAAYLARENNLKDKGLSLPGCAGCRPRGKNCALLKKRCARLREGQVQFCYECDDFPCRQLATLDRRYRTRYRTSLIENLVFIRGQGVEAFLQKEEDRWRCPDCGGTICCHNGLCYRCGLEKLQRKKQLYRWEE